MVNPISSINSNPATEAAKSSASKPQPPQQQKAQQPPDTVTLKSVGDVDHDGDSK